MNEDIATELDVIAPILPRNALVHFDRRDRYPAVHIRFIETPPQGEKPSVSHAEQFFNALWSIMEKRKND